MDNQKLRPFYDTVYKDIGYQKFFSTPSNTETEQILEIVSKNKWHGKRVLEIGCGEGDLAVILAICGASVLAIDYAEAPIEIAKQKYHLPNLEFRCCDYTDIKDKFDTVVMLGVLEHMDDPFRTLKIITDELLNRPGEIITSSPSFLNPRGYIWMALQLLLDIPMSLTDIHFLCPFDFEKWARELKAELSYNSVDQDGGQGKRLIADYEKRLKNAFKDKGLSANVDEFINWLSKTIEYPSFTKFSGANIVYTLKYS